MKNYLNFIFLFIAISSVLSATGQPEFKESKLPVNFDADFNVSGSILNQAQLTTDGFAKVFWNPNPQRMTYDTILCFDTLNNLNARLIRLYNDSDLVTHQSSEHFSGTDIAKNSHTYYKYYPDESLSEREYHIFDQNYSSKEKTLYSYFDNGRTIKMDGYFWQDSSWKQTNIVQLFFDSIGQMTGQKYYYRSLITHDLTLYRTFDLTYNEAGNILTTNNITREDGVFVRSDSLSNTYDPSGLYKMQEWIRYKSDSVSSSIETKDFTYNAEWELTSILYSRGFDSNMVVYRSDSLIYTNGKLYTNTSKYHNYNTGNFDVSSQILYEYPQEKVFVITNLSILADTLSPSNRSTKTYDENGDLQESFYEFIRPYSAIRARYEFENRNSVKGINEKLVNGTWIPNNTSNLFVQFQGVDVTGGLYETHHFTATFSNSESQGIVEYPSGETLVVYPNPAQHQISVRLNEKSRSNSQLKFIDALGRQAYSLVIVKGISLVEGIDISKLKSGFYTLLYYIDGKVVSQTKVVKN